MSDTKRRAKTAIVSFVHGLEQMQSSKEFLSEPRDKKSNLEPRVDLKINERQQHVANNSVRKNFLYPTNDFEQFTLPSGQSCRFLPKIVDADKCCVWSGNARDQTRIDLDDLNNLKASIQAQGQLVPILARPSKLSNNRITHEVIYGSRRLKACQELGIKIKILEAEISDQDAIFFMDAENASREDLSLYEKAIIYNKWLEDGIFLTRIELAKSLGISDRWVRQLLGFLKIPSSIIEALPSLKDLTSPRAEKILFYLSKLSDADLKIKQSVGQLRTEKSSYSGDELFERLFKDLSVKENSNKGIESWETKNISAEDGEIVLTIKTSKTGKINLEISRVLSPQRLSKFLDNLEKAAKKI